MASTTSEIQEHDLCPTCADKLTVIEMDRDLFGPICVLVDADGKPLLAGDAE